MPHGRPYTHDTPCQCYDSNILVIGTLMIPMVLLPYTHAMPHCATRKVHYVERVNAELHELLERYEAEFFQHQLQVSSVVWDRVPRVADVLLTEALVRSAMTSLQHLLDIVGELHVCMHLA